MDFSSYKQTDVVNFELLAKQIVEGFITGLHKSPFHGFSVEFSEHKLYNNGESTRHVDWKLFGKTDKLYTKKYEEETNLRCHIIIDNSASMHYPLPKDLQAHQINKIQFAALAAASLIEIFKKQRDAVGLSIYAEEVEFYAPEKANERHRNLLLHQLEQLWVSQPNTKTNTYEVLHSIASKVHQRSLLFVFTDLFQTDIEQQQLFDALKHLKYNKHEVVLFHTFDATTELNFDFDNTPKRFVDVETGESISLHAHNFAEKYKAAMATFQQNIYTKCLQYQLEYVPVNIQEGFARVLTQYLLSRRKFL